MACSPSLITDAATKLPGVSRAVPRSVLTGFGAASRSAPFAPERYTV